MGKKSTSKKKHDKSAPPKKNKPLIAIIIAIAVIGVVYLAIGNPLGEKTTNTTTRSFLVNGGETRPVMDPNQFTGMTREAYAAAKAAPEIIDKIYCYCYCDDPPFNHKSLLSCFVDYHGAS